MMSSNNNLYDEIIKMFKEKGNDQYTISEPITQIEHALQSYVKMKELGGDRFMRVAAFLHDIGHFLLKGDPIDPKSGINDYHELIGGKWLMLQGFDPKVYIPIMLHVDAKRYLVHVKNYPLSEGSKLSLELQGGPMSDKKERDCFEKSQHFKAAIMLRSCDDKGKEIKSEQLPTLESLRNEVLSCLL